MDTAAVITIAVTYAASVFAVVWYLGARLERRMDRLEDKVDRLVDTVHELALTVARLDERLHGEPTR